METVWIDQELCTLCGLCIPVCVRRIIEEDDEAARVTDPTRCILCGHCKAVCPEDAPQIPSLQIEEFESAPAKEHLPRANHLMNLFRSRRSIRIYRKEPVERDKLERIIQAGRFAPTGGNRQPLRYVVLQTPEKVAIIRSMALEALVRMAKGIEQELQEKRNGGEPLSPGDQIMQTYGIIWQELAGLHERGVDKLFYHAPALIICHVSPEITTTAQVDAGIAAMQMILMSEALSLGTCLCAFLCTAIESSPDLRKELHISEGHLVPFSFMVGYPDVTFLRLVSRRPARVKWL